MPVNKKQRWLPRIIIGLPMTLALLYYGLIAANRYVAESRVIVKHVSEQQAVPVPGLAGLLGGGGALPGEDEVLLKEHILSLDMLEFLERELKMKEAFAQTGYDFLYRLPSTATQERFFSYYLSRVEVSLDQMTSILTIRTEGFTPEFSQRLNQAILTESERFINGISTRIAQEQLDFATKQVERNLDRLTSARDDMLVFQNRHGMFDPLTQADVSGRMIMDMQARQADLEAELRNLQTYLNEDSAAVVSAKNAVRALQAQIAAEKNKVAAPGENNKINKVALQFLQVRQAVEFNTDLYKMSLDSLEKTRLDAQRKIKSLVIIASPHRPERSDWQRQLLNLATLLLITTLLYGLIKLSWAVIEDHRD